MIIDCISDLHGNYPTLEGGDLLIVAGDLTYRDQPEEYLTFNKWLSKQEYIRKIVIAGNHDNCLQSGIPVLINQLLTQSTIPIYGTDVTYLCDSGTEFEGLKIWASPWTPWFKGVNSKCKAFMKHDEELSEYWEKIPMDTDILITHGPPYGVLDEVFYEEYSCDSNNSPIFKKNAGSKSLALKIGLMKIPPKLWVCGHIHEAYGEDKPIRKNPCKMINCSHVNEHYQPVNKPIRVIL
jgi:Icc-related predicted phosphoesterase